MNKEQLNLLREYINDAAAETCDLMTSEDPGGYEQSTLESWEAFEASFNPKPSGSEEVVASEAKPGTWYEHPVWGQVLCCGSAREIFINSFAVRTDEGHTVIKYCEGVSLKLSVNQDWRNHTPQKASQGTTQVNENGDQHA